MTGTPADLASQGLIGGRTVQIIEGGSVECHAYPVASLPDETLRSLRDDAEKLRDQTGLDLSAWSIWDI